MAIVNGYEIDHKATLLGPCVSCDHWLYEYITFRGVDDNIPITGVRHYCDEGYMAQKLSGEECPDFLPRSPNLCTSCTSRVDIDDGSAIVPTCAGRPISGLNVLYCPMYERRPSCEEVPVAPRPQTIVR